MKSILNEDNRNSSSTPPLKPLRGARGILSVLENLLLNISVMCILIMGGVIFLSVLLRTLGFPGVVDDTVIVSELMIGALILPLAYIAADKGFIAVEIFTNWLSSKIKTTLNILSIVIGLAAVILIGYAGYLTMTHTIGTHVVLFSMLELPAWPGRTAFFVGYLVFFIRLVDLLIYEIAVSCGMLRKHADASDSNKI